MEELRSIAQLTSVGILALFASVHTGNTFTLGIDVLAGGASADTVGEGSSSRAGVNTSIIGGVLGRAVSVAAVVMAPGTSRACSLAVVALRASTIRAGRVANTVVSVLT